MKIVLFIASFVVIGLYVTNIILNDDTEMVAVAVFVVLYFAQFFINIDPKQPRVSEVSDDEEYDVEEYDEDDDTDAEYEETGSEQDE